MFRKMKLVQMEEILNKPIILDDDVDGCLDMLEKYVNGCADIFNPFNRGDRKFCPDFQLLYTRMQQHPDQYTKERMEAYINAPILCPDEDIRLVFETMATLKDKLNDLIAARRDIEERCHSIETESKFTHANFNEDNFILPESHIFRLAQETRQRILNFIPFNKRIELKRVSKQFNDDIKEIDLAEKYIRPKSLKGLINIEKLMNNHPRETTHHKLGELCTAINKISPEDKALLMGRLQAHTRRRSNLDLYKSLGGSSSKFELRNEIGGLTWKRIFFLILGCLVANWVFTIDQLRRLAQDPDCQGDEPDTVIIQCTLAMFNNIKLFGMSTILLLVVELLSTSITSFMPSCSRETFNLSNRTLNFFRQVEVANSLQQDDDIVIKNKLGL